MVDAIGLAIPGVYGPAFGTYRAWVVNTASQSRLRIDMTQIFEGVWLGQGLGGDISNFNEIIVTPEPTQGATSPTGPVILRGCLQDCKV